MNTNKYPTWLVPLGMAKKLKEVGFNEPCLYYSSEAISGMEYQCIEIEERIHNEVYNVVELRELKYFNYNKTKGCTSLPTWEQVLEWFRGKGFIGVVYYRYRIEDKGFSYEIIGTSKLFPIYNTYEEAREALIKEIINIYLIKKSKK